MRHLQGCSPVPLALLGLEAESTPPHTQHLFWRAHEVPTGQRAQGPPGLKPDHCVGRGWGQARGLELQIK